MCLFLILVTEKIHTSFAGRLFDTPRYDYKLSNSSEKWLELQNQASRYSLLGRKRLFKAYNSSKDAPYYRYVAYFEIKVYQVLH